MGDYAPTDLQMGIDPAYDFGSNAYADDMQKTKNTPFGSGNAKISSKIIAGNQNALKYSLVFSTFSYCQLINLFAALYVYYTVLTKYMFIPRKLQHATGHKPLT